MKKLAQSFSILWRAERMLAEARLRRTWRSAIYMGVAGIFVLMSLVMLNVSGFFWLSRVVGTSQSAFSIAIADLALAIAFLFTARNAKEDKNETLIKELRDTALSEIEQEAASANQQLMQICDDVRGMNVAVARFKDNPVNTIAPHLLVPAIKSFTAAVRASDKATLNKEA